MRWSYLSNVFLSIVPTCNICNNNSVLLHSDELVSVIPMIQPIALGPINESAIRFVEDLGRRISATSSEAREGVFLFQHLSVLMQRFNAIHSCS